MKKLLLLCLPLLVLASCAKPYYKTKGFKKETKSHRTVAILPVEMIFTGNTGLPGKEADIKLIEEAESKAFQTSFMEQLLASTKGGRNDFVVDIQAPTKTNRIILEQMTIQESWDTDPEVLAELLGVDAVIKNRIEKKRYFDDLTSYGIDVGVRLISLITKSLLPILGSKDISKNGEIYIRSSLLDGNSGKVLWTMDDTQQTDWKKTSSEVIDKLNSAVAKHFPYR